MSNIEFFMIIAGDGRRKLYEDDEDSPGSPGRGEAARQNYQVRILVSMFL